MNRRHYLLLMLAGLGTSLKRVSLAATNPDAMTTASRIIQRQVDAGALESAALHVWSGPRTFQRTFGKAGSTDALFLLGSLTKTMTATSAMVLADRNELRLSDPVMKFIPATGQR